MGAAVTRRPGATVARVPPLTLQLATVLGLERCFLSLHVVGGETSREPQAQALEEDGLVRFGLGDTALP